MELFHELLAEIERVPAVDVHTLVRAVSPGASDLSQIALYHFVTTELESAGIDPRVFEIGDAKKRLAEASAGFTRIKNTTSYWCLTQILGDLYDTAPPHEWDIEQVWAKAEKTAADPRWAETALERANVSKVFVTCDWRKALPRASEKFLPVLRVDSLVNEAHMSRTLESLTEVTGQSVYEAGDLKKAVVELVRKAKEGGAVAAAAAFEPQVDFEQGDRDAADRILSLVLLGQKTNREDRKALRSYVMDLVLQNCSEHEMPLQLMLGIKHVRSADRAITAYEPSSVAMYADLLKRHDGVKFDVFTSNDTICHELAVIARNYPNVFLSGHWWYLEFPTHIRKMLRERIEMLPMTKCCGFFSDARCVEWVYGRVRLIRRELAFALADLVREGYLSEGAAVEVAGHYLAENPKRIYGV